MNTDQVPIGHNGPSKIKSAPSEPGSSYNNHARFDQMPQNYTESQADATATTGSHVEYPSRSKQPAHAPNGNTDNFKGRTVNPSDTGRTTDDASFYSYHSARDLANFVKDFYGRTFNNQSDIYMMPSDSAEYQRLNKQHYAFVLGLNGLFPCADSVNELLAPREGERPAILDLGCGSGIWAMEVATQFPHCEVVGLDLAPVPVDIETLPPNCRFEIDNADLGLQHYHNYFDLIYVRCIGSGISDHRKMMLDVEACLKPNGIVFFIDGDQTIYQEDMVTPIAVGQERDEGGNPHDGSWLHRIAREIRYAAVYNGCDVDGLENCIDYGIWDHELIDPSTVKVASMATPLGIWAKARDEDTQQRVLYTGSLVRQDLMGASRGWHPMLLKYGIPQETLDKWSQRIDDELTSDKFRMSMRWRFTWGKRRANTTEDLTSGEDNEAPAPTVPPATPPYQPSIADRTDDFRFMDIYHTREEAAAMADLRRLKAKDLPTPMVVKIKKQLSSSG